MINPQAVDPFNLPSVLFEERKTLPNKPCIYFVIADGKIQYIGRSVNPQARWNAHYKSDRL